jgi:hypothetical protein
MANIHKKQQCLYFKFTLSGLMQMYYMTSSKTFARPYKYLANDITCLARTEQLGRKHLVPAWLWCTKKRSMQYFGTDDLQFLVVEQPIIHLHSSPFKASFIASCFLRGLRFPPTYAQSPNIVYRANNVLFLSTQYFIASWSPVIFLCRNCWLSDFIWIFRCLTKFNVFEYKVEELFIFSSVLWILKFIAHLRTAYNYAVSGMCD